MEDKALDGEGVRRSSRLYLPVSSGAALLFLLAASLVGDYPMVARFGGAVWVGLLSLIVSMPLVTARVKRKMREAAQS